MPVSAMRSSLRQPANGTSAKGLRFGLRPGPRLHKKRRDTATQRTKNILCVTVSLREKNRADGGGGAQDEKKSGVTNPRDKMDANLRTLCCRAQGNFSFFSRASVLLRFFCPKTRHPPSDHSPFESRKSIMVGVTGFEPATSWSQTRRSTKLSYTPKLLINTEIRRNCSAKKLNFPAPSNGSRMPPTQKEQALFEKVGECLYRNPSSGAYYARVEVDGKEIRRSLKTNDIHGRACSNFHADSEDSADFFVSVV